MSLLSLENVHVTFASRGTLLHAVNGVTMNVDKGEIVGIVGESGSGKTVLGLSLLQLVKSPPGKVTGSARFGSTNLLTSDPGTVRSIRGNKISMIFQDPSAAFNPYMRLSRQIAEPLRIHKGHSLSSSLSATEKALYETGIRDPSSKMNSYPHEFSGGMLQRAMIAMALITDPELVIADEPTTALDVTVQAQILSLLKKLQRERGMSVLFVTHNLGIVAGLCDRVAVMYAGRILETAPVIKLFGSTAHPYTRALLKSVPLANADADVKLFGIGGTPPDPTSPFKGCPFAPRCTYVEKSCTDNEPVLAEVGERHWSACARVVSGEISL